MLRVLIADKQQAVANSLARTLTNFGHQTAAAYSGQQALEVASVLRPDVFLSEVLLPRMTGIEAGILIRLMLPSCRVILFSEDGLTPGLFERAKSQGHDFETIRKPIDPQVLLSILTEPPIVKCAGKQQPVPKTPRKKGTDLSRGNLFERS
jgi:CheY-like chemotaxis protein